MGIEKGITKEVTVGEQAGSSEGLKNDAAINGEATNVETKETDRGISLVIPYLASEAQGDELKYAAIVGTDSPDLSETKVCYPEGSTRIEAVSWDGKRKLVYGEK